MRVEKRRGPLHGKKYSGEGKGSYTLKHGSAFLSEKNKKRSHRNGSKDFRGGPVVTGEPSSKKLLKSWAGIGRQKKKLKWNEKPPEGKKKILRGRGKFRPLITLAT